MASSSAQVGQVQRSCRIPAALARDYADLDVIVIEEVFDFGCWTERGVSLRDLFLFYGFPHMTSIVGERSSGDGNDDDGDGNVDDGNDVGNEDDNDDNNNDGNDDDGNDDGNVDNGNVVNGNVDNGNDDSNDDDGDGVERAVRFMHGGVMIASRYPIVDEVQYEYVALEPSGNQRKGVMYARVLKSVGSECKTYHVFGTHAQHGNSREQIDVRRREMTEFRAFIDSRMIPADEPTILAGDFNMDSLQRPADVLELLAILDVAAPPVVGEPTPTWDPENPFISPVYGLQFLDYVLYDRRGEWPQHADMRVVKPRSLLPFRVCVATSLTTFVWPDSPQCDATIAITDLSDHYAVIGRLAYGRGVAGDAI
ncbi:PREDICTED: sphingomyelinase C-like [Priapulus caudatus]|uniref:sphingomyelin phosphodiesterase n=1 Tax=Priapulus caudatus TaxID=37621 RepID=A0ABM1E4K3_PRICU|nr:PREDICTED: sphingomyelinase C-like [Priapulus caudatus]